MAKRSAGILMYRRGAAVIELLLVHPGGPFWTSKDHGAWSIPKGEYAPGEDALTRSFRNLERTHVVEVGELEVADVVWAHWLVVSTSALATLEGGKSE